MCISIYIQLVMNMTYSRAQMFCLGLCVKQHATVSWLDENQAFGEDLCEWEIIDLSAEASEHSCQYLSLLEYLWSSWLHKYYELILSEHRLKQVTTQYVYFPSFYSRDLAYVLLAQRTKCKSLWSFALLQVLSIMSCVPLSQDLA